MARIVARGSRSAVSAQPDVAFLIGWVLDPQSRSLSVGNGRTRNGSIPPSLDRRCRLGRHLRSFRFLDAPPPDPDIASARSLVDTPRVNTTRRRSLLVGVTLIATLAIAIPVMGADPSPPAGPPGQAKPDKSNK